MCDRAVEGYTGDMETLRDKMEKNQFPLDLWINIDTNSASWVLMEAEAYYLDGLARLSYIAENDDLIAKVKSKIDPVLEMQDSDGFFFRPGNKEAAKKSNLEQGLLDEKYTYTDDGEGGTNATSSAEKLLPNDLSRDYWVIAVFNRAVLALYDASGEERYINFLKRFFDGMPEFEREVPEELPISGTEMHFSRHLVNIETLFEVADRLQDKDLAAKGMRILKGLESGLYKSFLDKNFDYARVCHAVTFQEVGKVFAATNMVDNEDYIRSVENAYDFLREEQMQPYGATTGNEYMQGVGAFNSTELCDIVDLSWSSTWLIRNTGKGIYGDQLERAFFNALPATIDQYQSHIYVFSPNRIPNVDIPHRTAAHEFRTHHTPFCCTGNLNRGLPIFIQNMLMRSDDGGLAFVSYGPNKANVEVNGKEICLTTNTEYPFRDQIDIELNKSIKGAFKLYFRIPGWCEEPSIAVNGKRVKLEINDGGFACIERVWSQGDKISCVFPMETEIVQGNEIKLMDNSMVNEIYFAPGGARVDSKSNVVVGSPYAYVTRGPLLYALAADSASNNEVADSDWSYNFALNPSFNKFKINYGELSNDWVWSDKCPPVTLEMKAQEVDWTLPQKNPKLPSEPFVVDKKAERKITLIPFGCTKFRISMFPTTETK